MVLLQYLADATAKIDPGAVNIPTISANEVLKGVLGSVYMAAGIVAVVAIVLSGYSFVTSVYDPAKITQAKNALLYSVVGLIVVIIAFFITQFVIGGFK
jgi:FtsH-binding integral membrane protein